MSEQIIKALESVESKLNAMSTKADSEIANIGKVSADTKTAIENIGVEQRILADRMLQLEQRAPAQPEIKKDESWGEQFIKSARYADFAGGQMNKLRVEV